MPIPPQHANRRIYHFTHIDNLPSIIATGLLANNHIDFPVNGHRSVAEQTIQDRRARMVVTCGPAGVVHDYVPLYFASRSPMLLAVVRKRNVDQCDMIFLEFPISLLYRNDVVFTDASANTEVPPNFYDDPDRLDALNWTAIVSRSWKSETDALRHQRMAEVLVHGRLSVEDAQRIAVWDETAQRRVQAIGRAAGIPLPPVVVDRWNYFTRFLFGEPDRSLVMGPRGIKKEYEHACRQIATVSGASTCRYQTLHELLNALRHDFGTLPQTAELVGLETDNEVHHNTVDIHTREVVRTLRASRRFADLPSDADRDMVELAAYLHDIGKGPRARWPDGIQKVDADHPVRAMPMMVDILTTQLGPVSAEDAELLMKLVCYHDLIGDVLGKGRDEQQIVEVADDERQLALLFALGQADATSLVEGWWREPDAAALFDRCVAAIRARR